MADTTNIGPDFCLVQLTADGAALAGGAPLRVSNGQTSVVFTPGGDPVKVARYEWAVLLRDHNVRGKLLFEMAPQPAASVSGTATVTT